MIFAGIDLAAREKNITGVAIIEDIRIGVYSVHRDDEIIGKIVEHEPSIVAIDAPMSLENRRVDIYLRKYGALSLKIPAMQNLAKRGMRIKRILEKKYKVIEVFPTATAKILGFYDKDKKNMLSYFKNRWSVEDVRNEHEVDAIIAAYTALLYAKGECVEMDGVVFPKEENL
ncbi:conserved hypothetical protein [Aciduliprofundum boonei T469]|nr:conserved hypothetical protein [Aciduliprofundum boonei T469]